MAESVGEQLRLAREARNLTFDQVSEATRIRPYYIQALEKDDYSAVPSAAQARGFLRIYATYLGLNVDEILAKTRPVEAVPGVSPSAGPAPDVPATPVPTTTPAQPMEKPRPGFLTSLLERFARQSAAQPPESAVTPMPAATQPEPLPEPVPSMPKPVATAAIKEELPNRQAKPLPEQPASKKPSIEKDKTLTKKAAAAKSAKSRPVSKDKEVTTSTKPKRTAVRPAKSPEDVSPAEPVDEKKKMTE